MKGIITDIQRFSLHDGPGIRTTVFLKGCNMACAWCHNPESIRMAPELLYYSEKCIGCLECVAVCPGGAHSLTGDGAHVFERTLCRSCGACAGVCFAGASVMAGREMTVAEVMAEVLQDRDYYARSGGGLTLSGGEVLMQPTFAAALLQAAKAHGIATAVETNLSAPWETVAQVVANADLVMLDIKLFGNLAHRRWTGLGNDRVLANVRALAEAGVAFMVRTPIIPGVNDSAEVVQEVAGFLAGLAVRPVYELLRFNPLGGAKYRALQVTDRFAGAAAASDMERLASAVRACGIQVKVS